MSLAAATDSAPRRYDLDWIRVIVFGLLILYHVGMFFVPWDWHIKNNTTEPWLTWPMAFLNRWRLPILFVISGMGTRLALSKRSGREFLAERTMRLLVPLLFGILVVVPPQVYVERQVEGAEFSSYLEFYPHFFQGIYPTGNFSWHHLWFLPYLLVYSFVLSPVFLYLRNHPQAGWQRAVQRGLGNGAIWLALAIPLLIVEVGLRPYFPTTHNLIWDWYNFTRYLLLFFYGFLLISVQPAFWKALDRWGGAGLVVGLLTFALLTWFRDQPLRFSGAIYLAAIVEVVNLGAWCVAIFGLAARLLRRC